MALDCLFCAFLPQQPVAVHVQRRAVRRCQLDEGALVAAACCGDETRVIEVRGRVGGHRALRGRDRRRPAELGPG